MKLTTENTEHTEERFSNEPLDKRSGKRSARRKDSAVCDSSCIPCDRWFRTLIMKTLLLGVLCAVISISVTAAESISVLLQKGIFAEETEGNLDVAIKIYEGIVAEGEANRSLVAQAQYRLGMCRLKLGMNEEAATGFQKLVNQFSDAAELVARSRERLAELGKPASAMIVRQIWSGSPSSGSYLSALENNCISPDGRYLAIYDMNSGNLGVHDLHDGKRSLLTEHGSWEEPVRYAASCTFSPDGKQLAYTWIKAEGPKSPSFGLHLISLENSNSRTLVGQQTDRLVFAQDWSPDGNSIAVFDWRGEGTNRNSSISLVSVADGATRPILQLNGSGSSTLRFSADGQYLACNLQRNSWTPLDSTLTNDIVVVDIQNGTQRTIVEHVAGERFVDWDPRGSGIIFMSERRGSMDLWSVAVRNGQVQGVPKLLKANSGDVEPLGILETGAFYFSTTMDSHRDLHAGKVDFETGKVLSPPKLVRSSETGSRGKEIWSSDGRSLLFTSRRKGVSSAYVLALDPWQPRQLEGSEDWADRVGWWWPSRDSKTLIVALGSGGPAKPRGQYLVDIASGGISPLAQDDPEMGHPALYRGHFTGQSVAFFRLYASLNKLVLVKHDLRNGQEREYHVPGEFERTFHRTGRPVLLPDGKTLFFNQKKGEGEPNILFAQNLETGVQKEIARSDRLIDVLANSEGDLIRLAFGNENDFRVYQLFSFANSEMKEILKTEIPDNFKWKGEIWRGPHVILERIDRNLDSVPAEVWTLAIKTGGLKKTDLTLPRSTRMYVHEETNHLVFQSAAPAQGEIWVIENLLPTATAKN